ncbi:unnamed protein product, partial [Symbiodinium sp. KB8]
LATQQAKMMEVVAAVVDRLDSIVAQGGKPPAPEQPPAPQPVVPHPVLSQPLAQAATATPLQVDLEEKGQQGLVTGEPIGSTQEGSLASAVLAQSQALVALVSQLSSSSDPLLEVPTGQASVRGAAGRAKLQQDLASRSGGFAQKVRDNMARRMDPTGLLPEDQVSFLRYLERHGGYAGQPLLGLVAWQVAQALDLTAIGATEGAKDSLSLLLLMLDQTAHDKGSSSLGWLLTLQADPPSNLFAPQPSVPGSNLQSFSPLAEQRWITTALAYAKELETISSRIAEGQPKAPQPRPPPKSPAIPQAQAADEEQQLSKKQLRAAQWAARKAGAVPSCAGRKGLQLAARLSEVVVFLRDQGFEAGGYPTTAEPPSGFVGHAPGAPEALTPYRNILADQVVLHGRGSWDLSRHLGPELYLPYVEPDCFRFSGTGGPCATLQGESKSELYKLARVWDASGLLGLTAGPLPDRMLTRVFGAYKAPGKQRQIGDRRGQNSWESRLDGPSKWLPTGPLLCRLHVPAGFCLVGSVTDRRDFYTQAAISRERASTNVVGPALPLAWFADTKAASEYRRQPRDHCVSPAAFADQIEFEPPPLLAPGAQLVHPTFHALFQGDAGGVEFATAGHEGLLQSSGCLLGPGRLQSSHPVSSAGPWQGLIIDDYFALAVQPGHFLNGSPSPSSLLVDRAKEGYARETVLGSDDKDVRDQRHFKVAGAEVDSSGPTVAEGKTLCGYPVGKRLALAAASVRAAQCPALSEELVSTLCGSWVSCLLYRRCLMSALDKLFALGRTQAAPSCPGSDLKPLSRTVASELQLLAVLAPVAVSDLSVTPEVSLQLWLASDFKGAAVSLDSSRCCRPPPGEDEELMTPDAPSLHVDKPFAFGFDVLEVGEPSLFSAEARAQGLQAGPVLHCTRSRHYDLASPRFREWLVHLVCTKQVRALLLRPSTDTFARAGHPPLRSSQSPLGFRRGFGPVCRANRVASTCFAVLLAAARHGVAACVFHPVSSLLCAHPAWISLRAPRTQGFESLLANDLLLASDWKVVSEWRWRRKVHINVLETLAAVRVARKAAASGGDCKVVLLLDSTVGRGAIAKGRSSSRLLRPALLKMSATLVAGGVHLGMSHAPTRLNVADDPTLCVDRLASSCAVCFRATSLFRPQVALATPLPRPLTRRLVFLEKGPSRRATTRTALNRGTLLKSFEDWLAKAGHSATGYAEWPAEEVARALARYGRELFEAGYPYWHLSETINSVAAKRPAIRRQLQGAWDVAFAWMAMEPHTHHVAMPAVVLLAILAVSLLWGWKQEAGLFGLAWGALLRIGEATGALREALVLPRDVLYSQDEFPCPTVQTVQADLSRDAEKVRRSF